MIPLHNNEATRRKVPGLAVVAFVWIRSMPTTHTPHCKAALPRGHIKHILKSG